MTAVVVDGSVEDARAFAEERDRAQAARDAANIAAHGAVSERAEVLADARARQWIRCSLAVTIYVRKDVALRDAWSTAIELLRLDDEHVAEGGK